MGCKGFFERMHRRNEHTLIRWELVWIAEVPAVGDDHTNARGTPGIQPLPFNVVLPITEISELLPETSSLLITNY